MKNYLKIEISPLLNGHLIAQSKDKFKDFFVDYDVFSINKEELKKSLTNEFLGVNYDYVQRFYKSINNKIVEMCYDEIVELIPRKYFEDQKTFCEEIEEDGNIIWKN